MVKKERFSLKAKEKLSESCFLMWDFITQNSTLPFLEQIANTVVVDSAK